MTNNQYRSLFLKICSKKFNYLLTFIHLKFIINLNTVREVSNMLKEERYENILDILDEEKFISVFELSKRLYVSLPTIRRDLSALQKQDKIIRSHGGARKLHIDNMQMPIEFRKTLQSSEKKQMCKIAADLVCDNDVIYIDASTSTYQIGNFLSDKKAITVITNSIPLSILLKQNGISSYCTGGAMQINSSAYSGVFAEEFIRKFNIDIMFISSSGINSDGYINDISLSETQLRKVAINQSKKVVFLCDGTKFNLFAPYNLIPIHNVSYLITNDIRGKDFFDPKDKEKVIII